MNRHRTGSALPVLCSGTQNASYTDATWQLSVIIQCCYGCFVLFSLFFLTILPIFAADMRRFDFIRKHQFALFLIIKLYGAPAVAAVPQAIMLFASVIVARLPAVLHVFTEGIEILNRDLSAVIQYNCPAPESVNLVAVHAHDADVQVTVVIIEGLHRQVKASIL